MSWPTSAFDHIDDLNALAACILSPIERTIWEMTVSIPPAPTRDLARALGCTEQWARTLRSRVQIKVREAMALQVHGAVRFGHTIAYGQDVVYAEDTVAVQVARKL